MRKIDDGGNYVPNDPPQSMTPKNAPAVHAYEEIAHRIAELVDPGRSQVLSPAAIPETCERDGATLLRSPENLQGGAEILRCPECTRIAGMILTDGAYVYFPAKYWTSHVVSDGEPSPDEPPDDRGLIVGRWYWTRTERYPEEWTPMKHDPAASGGWTNDDCGEDYGKSITEWKLIPLPEELP